ncbi:MAG: type I glutamate--ammonia ligase [Dehalococcoidia bacterium]|tara:strand:+ start:1440 stop:2852 length:1413 start_codon:yes stop_codon:yes gene_type:complete
MNFSELKKIVDENDVRRVDLRVTDMPGRWQQFTIPVDRLTENLFDEGQGFDGSSLRGFQEIHESDMLLIPDMDSARIEPISEIGTLVITCSVKDPITGEEYGRDPRTIAKKAEAYMKDTGIADTANFGPELEFFLFDDVRFEQSQQTAFYYIDSIEAHWNSGRDEAPNLGYKIPGKEGYAPVAPFDTLRDVRWEMHEALHAVGIPTEVSHHEVATAGQGEIATKYNSLLKKADEFQWYKYIVRNIAKDNGMVATFMPKPIWNDNGTGMHTHQSLWKDGKPLFFNGDNYGGLSDMARHYIGGLLKHAPAVLAFAAPSTNSYKRLVPGFEAPVNLVYSARNRSAVIRISTYDTSPASKRIEFRAPDPTCNPYLAFSAMLLAGLDGVQNKIEPPDPVDENIYELPESEAAKLAKVPGSLAESLQALENDNDFLTSSGVFTSKYIQDYLDMKNEEITELSMRPTPYEYELYFDA